MLRAPADQAKWQARDTLREQGDLLASLGISIGEAAWRGDDMMVGKHVKEAQTILLDAIATLKKLEAATGDPEAVG
jgi:hypothetical protein